MSHRPAGIAATIRVVIADDDLSILETLTGAISSDPRLEVVAAAKSPDEAVLATRAKRPDVVVVDARMPEGGGLRAVRKIVEDCPDTRVVALSTGGDQENALKVLSLGATSDLVKGLGVDELCEAIRKTAAGLSVIAPEVVSGLDADPAHREDGQGGRETHGAKEARIRLVISRGSFTMYFQPIVDLASGLTVGFEALARFPTEPIRGTEAWFDEAERVGAGVDLDLASIRSTFIRLPLLPPTCYLSLNVTPATVASRRLAALLDEVSGDRMVLELTEHAAVDDYEGLDAAMERLRQRGVRFAIDDVGAGFASLRHLLNLRPDIVKLDRSLCRHVDSGPGRALLEGLVSFSSRIGAQLVAEGLESWPQVHALRDLGVGFGQGYVLGPPRAIPRPRGAARRRIGAVASEATALDRARARA